jgi:hypothetical protein
MPAPLDPLVLAAQQSLGLAPNDPTDESLGLNLTGIPSGYLDLANGLTGRGNLSKTTSQGAIDHWADNPDAYDHVILAGKPLLGLCRLKGKGYEQRLHRKKIAGRNGESVKFLALEPAEFHIEWEMWMPAHWKCYQDLIPTLKNLKQLPTQPDFSDVVGGASTRGLVDVTFTPPAGGNPTPFTTSVLTVIGEDQGSPRVPATGSGTDPKVAETAAKAAAKLKKAPQYATPIIPIYHPFLAAIGVSQVHILRLHMPEDKDGKGTYIARIECLEAFTKTKSMVGTPQPLDPNALKSITAQRTRKPQTTQAQLRTFNPPPSTVQTSVDPALG